MTSFKIGRVSVGDNYPVAFIAEIGSNHEGSIDKAKHLAALAKKAGASICKFQHYSADTLASRGGFGQIANLAHYRENPYDVFKKYEVPWEWTPILKEYCDSIDIEFMSTPYSVEAVDHLEPYVNAYKIGSGDITYTELLRYIVSKGKPILLSTGAADYNDVSRAYMTICERVPICIMQCNTNYNPDDEPGAYLNLKMIQKYASYFDATVGWSCHSQGWDTACAAVALGAKIIEAHFTDNKKTNPAPDTPFARNPYDFKFMVTLIRGLENTLGDGIKKVEENEKETVVLQRRCLRAAKLLVAGSVIGRESISILRPAPVDSYPPYAIENILGKTLKKGVVEGEHFTEEHFR